MLRVVLQAAVKFYLVKLAPVPLCPPQTPMLPGRELGRCGEKPATNRLSYGTV
jgi:hypothetical protein